MFIFLLVDVSRFSLSPDVAENIILSVSLCMCAREFLWSRAHTWEWTAGPYGVPIFPFLGNVNVLSSTILALARSWCCFGALLLLKLG